MNSLKQVLPCGRQVVLFVKQTCVQTSEYRMDVQLCFIGTAHAGGHPLRAVRKLTDAVLRTLS